MYTLDCVSSIRNFFTAYGESQYNRDSHFLIRRVFFVSKAIFLTVMCHSDILSVLPSHSQWDARVSSDGSSMMTCCELIDGVCMCWWSIVHGLHTSLKGGSHCCCTFLLLQFQSLLPKYGALCPIWHWNSRGGWVCLSGVLQKAHNQDHHRTCLLPHLSWSVWVQRHLHLLPAFYQIREVSASSGGHLCRLEVLRACWQGVTWWRSLLLLHAERLSCIHSRRKCNQHQLLLKTLPLQGEFHSEFHCNLDFISVKFSTN